MKLLSATTHSAIPLLLLSLSTPLAATAHSGGSDRGHEHTEAMDSESDRYTFNAGGKHTGTFRYSFRDNEYVMLDRSPYVINSYESGDNSYFWLSCPDNTAYVFSEHEKTEPGEDFDEFYPTTTWNIIKRKGEG